MSTAKRCALKEWALAIRALGEGRQVVLMRKGGIVEETGDFDLVSERFLLYPTFYHQEPSILKPDVQSWLADMPTEAPERIPVMYCACVTDLFPVEDAEAIDRLASSHIWTAEYIKDRFYWKPEKPLTTMVLRVYRLPAPGHIDPRPEYGGCRSWVDLFEPVDVDGMIPVLDDKTFGRLRADVVDAISPVAG
ncbi:MAG: hypothetical protein CME19_19055 [Gemmatimonadetes bacterium]|nr:hypothetical protein [Gemmatimonadota bacterium]